jgi:hypothetical protein
LVQNTNSTVTGGPFVIKAKLKFHPDRYRHCYLDAHSKDVTGTWEYTVSANVRGKSGVVFVDSTGGSATHIPANLFEQAERDVVVADRMFWSGHTFSHSYAEIVDGWPNELENM